MVVLVFFEFSYATRFIYDQFIEPIVVKSLFWYVSSFDLVLFPEGLSFLALLYFHYRNYRPARNRKQQRTLTTQASNRSSHFANTVDINASGGQALAEEATEGNIAKVEITNSESDYVYLPKN